MVFCILIIIILIILIIVIFVSVTNSSNSSYSNRCRNNNQTNGCRPRPTGKENYGPPPGKHPAIDYKTMGPRGWPSYSYDYSGNTASALINFIEPWPEYKYEQRW